MVLAAEIVKTAVSFLETPYVLGGRIRGRGIDCAGIVVLCGLEHGIEILCPKVYKRANSLDFIENACGISMQKVTTKPVPGMVIVSKVGPYLHHLGVMDSLDTVIEARNEPSVQKVVRSDIDFGTICSIFAFRGVFY